MCAAEVFQRIRMIAELGVDQADQQVRVHGFKLCPIHLRCVGLLQFFQGVLRETAQDKFVGQVTACRKAGPALQHALRLSEVGIVF